MEIPGFVEEWEKAGKEGTKMKLIWNELLQTSAVGECVGNGQKNSP